MSVTAVIDLVRKRGDTYPIQSTMTNNGTPLNIATGYSFRLTVDPSPDPTSSATNLFQLPGTITDGPNGKVEFRPSLTNVDLAPNTYFYDIQMKDNGGYLTTVAMGKFTIQQDITKDTT